MRSAALLLLTFCALAPAGCRRRHTPAAEGAGTEARSGAGQLHRIAARLEEAYAQGPLPPTHEPPSLADRLAKWNGFRECAARTYAARRAQAAAGAPVPQGSIGWAAVEECAVQGAVADKDASLCGRLAEEFPGTGGKPGTGALRCHDTRARVLGLPDECPVVDWPGARRGRNPECLAAARRDASLCAFADNPARCRAILIGDEASCSGAAANCRAAVAYWGDLIPRGDSHALVDAAGDATFDVVRKRQGHFRFVAPPWATGVSWPTASAAGPVVVGWGGGLELSFDAKGARSGTRRPSLSVVVADAAGARVRCAPDARSTLEIGFDAGTAAPGAVVHGTLTARDLPCADGDSTDVTGRFNLPILDVR